MNRVRRWTDEEIGFLEANPDMTAREAGDVLGRSESSVWAARSKMRRGEVSLAPWSEEELDFLRSTPHLTISQHAEHLGRKESTIVGVRQRLARREGINWGGASKTPHHVGRRRLLARTCIKCGLLLDASWFVLRKTGSAAGMRFHACMRCCKSNTDESREKQAAAQAKRRQAGSAADSRRLQRLSLSWAERLWQPYTEADMKVLSDPDMTDIEKSFHLKRTYAATKTARARHGFTSKVGKGDPMKGRWVIDNPNAPSMEKCEVAA